MSDRTPSENTLTVNNTHQMLSDIERDFQTIAALSPSREMENVVGYDVNLPLLKSTVFQYKRPYTVKTDSDRRFELNDQQRETLVSLHSRKEAFFTFPEIVNVDNLSKVINNTVFIDVYAFRPDTSLVYLPENACEKGSLSNIKAKLNGDHRYSIPRNAVYNWDELRAKIDSCEVGLKIREDEEPTAEFKEYKNRVEHLTEGDVGWIVERILRTSENQPVEYQNELRNRLERLAESDTDLSTYGIGRSKYIMFGRR